MCSEEARIIEVVFLSPVDREDDLMSSLLGNSFYGMSHLAVADKDYLEWLHHYLS